MVAAIRTEGWAKSFGRTMALRPLDLEVAGGEVLGYLGPNGAGKTTTIRCLLGMIRATAGRAEIFGVDAQAHPAEAHRRLAYVPGEANLWPGLTGEETLHLLGEVQGQVDVAYRDELVERFELDPSKRVRAYSKGNRQKVLLIAALSSRGRRGSGLLPA
jgi:ABC-2 type transport system ATP-binding protein